MRWTQRVAPLSYIFGSSHQWFPIFVLKCEFTVHYSNLLFFKDHRCRNFKLPQYVFRFLLATWSHALLLNTQYCCSLVFIC